MWKVYEILLDKLTEEGSLAMKAKGRKLIILVEKNETQRNAPIKAVSTRPIAGNKPPRYDFTLKFLV
jgi:hypothetical protein